MQRSMALRFVALVVLLWAMVSPCSAAPAAPAEEDGANVEIQLFVGKSGGTSSDMPRTYKILGRAGSSARMLMGWRMPIPTSQEGGRTGDAQPATSYVYQNVGVTADLDTTVLSGGRIRLRGQVEVSGVRQGQVVDAHGTRPPLIGTFQQFVDVVVQEKKKIRIAEAPDPEGGMLFLEIQADVLD